MARKATDIITALDAEAAGTAASAPTGDPAAIITEGEVAEAAAAGGAAAAPEPDQTDWLVVAGPREGRRRAGRHFGADPVRIALADLSDAELQALESDPLLATYRLPPAA